MKSGDNQVIDTIAVSEARDTNIKLTTDGQIFISRRHKVPF